MACCKNKGSCSQNQHTQPVDGHIEPMTMASFDLVIQLVDAAKGGLCDPVKQILKSAVFKNEQLKNLADTIISLVAENEQLKKLGGLFNPPEITLNGQNFELSFGPKNAYKLSLPLEAGTVQQDFAKQLRAIADKLEEKTPAATQTAQMTFLF